MPCSDGRDSPSYLHSENNQLRNQIANEQERKVYLEATLCAIFNTLARQGTLTSVISEAEKSGQISILPLWEAHVKDDMNRMKKTITEQFSADEIALIRALVQGKEL